MSDDAHKITMETTHRLPGGQMTIALTCFFPGTIPSAFIVSEPNEVTPASTKLRDQVALLNALRQIGKPKYLTMIVEADKACHDVLLPAHNLMTVPAAAAKAVAA